MKSYLFLLVILFSCSKLDSLNPNCKNNGKIDFMMIDMPCKEAIKIIDALFAEHPLIFDYDIINESSGFTIINYCYDEKYSSKDMKTLLNQKGFTINQKITPKEKDALRSLYCQ